MCCRCFLFHGQVVKTTDLMNKITIITLKGAITRTDILTLISEYEHSGGSSNPNKPIISLNSHLRKLSSWCQGKCLPHAQRVDSTEHVLLQYWQGTHCWGAACPSPDSPYPKARISAFPGTTQAFLAICIVTILRIEFKLPYKVVESLQSSFFTKLKSVMLL